MAQKTEGRYTRQKLSLEEREERFLTAVERDMDTYQQVLAKAKERWPQESSRTQHRLAIYFHKRGILWR